MHSVSVHTSTFKGATSSKKTVIKLIECNTSLVPNKQDLSKRGPLIKERLSNLPLFCSVLTAFDIENHSKRAGLNGGRGVKNSTLHHFTSLSTQLSEDAELFLCLCLMVSLLIEIWGSERKQWYTPILLYYSPLHRQMGPCLDGSHPKLQLQLPAFLLFLSFPFIDFFLNPPLIHLFTGCSWSTDCWEPEALAAEAPAGSARDYSHYSVRLHWALVLCATSPPVSWQSEL